MDGIDIVNSVEGSRKVYSEDWDFTSQLYHEKGYYDNLCNQLSTQQKVLEIGCGTGYSTFSLSKKHLQIISIDENTYCINKSFNFLKSKNVDVLKKTRGNIIGDNHNLLYRMTYEKLAENFSNKVTLIEGNITNDEHLKQYLLNQDKFDYITCWMPGAHGLILNEESQRLKGRNSLNRTAEVIRAYKFDVIESVASIAKNILKEGGQLHLVERISANATTQFSPEEIFQIYVDILKPFNFDLNGKERLLKVETKSQMEMVSQYGGKEDKMLLVDMNFIIISQ